MHGRIFLVTLLLTGALTACSSSNPPDSLFIDDIQRMVMLDREIGFNEDIAEIKIIKRTMHDRVMEVEIRVIGRTSHPEISMGATLPARPEPQDSWATWKYFVERKGKIWEIENKFKVAEGFY